MSQNKYDYVKVRSVLANHVESMLEFLSSKKEEAKNESEDIFAAFDADTNDQEALRWNLQSPQKTKLQILKEEKNSLGVYMSGNPLENYVTCLDLFRKTTGMHNSLHIVVADKVKKVFTKANAMMFALQLTTADGEIEGVIFSRDAMKYSPILEDNTLYWVIGRVDDKAGEKRKAKEQKQLADKGNDAPEIDESSGDTVDPVQVQEYIEKPKMLVSHIARFDEGFLSFLQSSDQPPSEEFSNQFPNIDWLRFSQNPEYLSQFTAEIEALHGLYEYKEKRRGGKKRPFNPKWKPREKTPDQEQKEFETPKKLKVTLYKSLGDKIKTIKESLKKEPTSGHVAVELWVEVKAGEVKKVKGDFWIPKELISSN